ncbi:Hypothetical protein DHA2_151216 [Giardia duodenalis]|uniref:Uncharacterized protein n=1 Tax=Giardia intestinalis TaxID=5741 RepID=V6TD11_GIAIN|nr:Hypothetical protein DHA2_151216 [Giardia intestinalis]
MVAHPSDSIKKELQEKTILMYPMKADNGDIANILMHQGKGLTNKHGRIVL